MNWPFMYLVTTGEYSDYRVEYALLHREEADALAAWLGSDYRVEPVELVDGWAERPMVDELSIRTTIGSHSASSPYEYHRKWLGAERNTPACTHLVRATKPFKSLAANVQVLVQGTDHERVRKVSSEQVAQAKADFDILVAAAPDYEPK